MSSDLYDASTPEITGKTIKEITQYDAEHIGGGVVRFSNVAQIPEVIFPWIQAASQAAHEQRWTYETDESGTTYALNEDLNKFISKRIERVKSMTTTYLTTWGELFSKTYSGINCFARGIAELSTQLTPEKVEKADFLNVYIPSGRNEVIKIDWLNNYATRSMLIKSKAQSNKIAS